MRIDTLKQFLAICAEGSINKAAQQLYISQQGLDSAIKRLEKELRVPLFHHSKNGITLTPEGTLLKQYAEQMVSSFEEFEVSLAKLQLNRSEQEYTISIAVNPLLTSFLTDFIFTFNNENSHITCKFVEVPTEDIPALVEQNIYDIGLVSYVDSKSFTSYTPVAQQIAGQMLIYPVITDSMTISMGKKHPLAHKNYISQKEYQSLSYKITMTNNTRTFTDTGYSDMVVLYSNDFKMHEKYLQNNNCVCMLPAFLSKTYFNPDYIHIAYFDPDLPHKTVALFAQNETLSPQKVLFYNELKKFFQQYICTL